MRTNARKVTEEERERARKLIEMVDTKLKKGQIAIRPPVTSRYSFKDQYLHGSASEDRMVNEATRRTKKKRRG